MLEDQQHQPLRASVPSATIVFGQSSIKDATVVVAVRCGDAMLRAR